MQKLPPYSGSLLYADPMMNDPHFGRAVILLANNDDEGSVGFIVNKKLEVSLNDILPDPLPRDFDVYYGGPVGTDTLYFVHSLGEKVPESRLIGHNIYWGGDFDMITQLMETQEAGPHNIKFFVGYAGWGNLQLDDEISSNAWIVGHEKPGFIFDDTACTEAWREKMNLLGSKFAVWANFPQNPSMN